MSQFDQMVAERGSRWGMAGTERTWRFARILDTDRGTIACEVVVDCRLLPGTTPADIEPTIRSVLGGDVSYEIEFTEAQGGTRSALDTELWRAVESFVAETEPGAQAVPICTAGFTDSHWLREAFGTVAYGFFPARMPPELMASLIHSADERTTVDDLELGVAWLRHAARTLLS